MKAALFDLDGTLLNTEWQYTIFWTATAAKYLPEQPDFAQKIKGTTLVSIISHFEGEELREDIKRSLEEFERNMTYPLVAGAEEFVKSLKAQGVKCAIVTSSDIAKMNVVWERIGDFLRLFDIILVSEDFKASKPDPDCYLQAAARLGVETSDCVVFEDALTGLAAGRNANMFVVGLATGLPREVIENKCDMVIDDFLSISLTELQHRVP